MLTNPHNNAAHNGSVPYRTAAGCLFQIPYLMGFGGNVVVLLPNGLSAFRFADSFHFDYRGDTVWDGGICAIDVRLCRVFTHATAASVPFTLKCSWKN